MAAESADPIDVYLNVIFRLRLCRQARQAGDEIALDAVGCNHAQKVGLGVRTVQAPDGLGQRLEAVPLLFDCTAIRRYPSSVQRHAGARGAALHDLSSQPSGGGGAVVPDSMAWAWMRSRARACMSILWCARLNGATRGQPGLEAAAQVAHACQSHVLQRLGSQGRAPADTAVQHPLLHARAEAGIYPR